MTIRDRVAPLRPVGQTLRVRVLPSAVKEDTAVNENSAKPRVYGYVRAGDQDLITCWAYEHGWLLSKVFVDEYPGFGAGMSDLLATLRTTDVEGVVLLGEDSYTRAIARRITSAGKSCMVVPPDYVATFTPADRE